MTGETPYFSLFSSWSPPLNLFVPAAGWNLLSWQPSDPFSVFSLRPPSPLLSYLHADTSMWGKNKQKVSKLQNLHIIEHNYFVRLFSLVCTVFSIDPVDNVFNVHLQRHRPWKGLGIFIFICYNRTFNIFVIHDWNVSRVWHCSHRLRLQMTIKILKQLRTFVKCINIL